MIPSTPTPRYPAAAAAHAGGGGGGGGGGSPLTPSSAGASAVRPSYSKRWSVRAAMAPGNIDAHIMTDEEVDAMLENFTKEDKSVQKTWTRLLVENVLSKFKWYFPRRDAASGPSLSKAYAYYEHVTLPRRFVSEQTAEHVLRRAEPGETEATELYDPFRTPSSAFIEWGVGIDLYFTTLRVVSGILLVAGLINLGLILFYGSLEYSPDGKVEVSSFTLSTSAVCTTGEWVVCTDCNVTEINATEEIDRLVTATDGTVLITRNACKGGQLAQGMQNYATGFFLVGSIALLSLYLRAREVRSDEDKLTATDYSVIVRNPPPDALNADEWHDFFSQFADKQVTAVTIALNNEKLLNKLIARRYHLRNLQLILPKGTDIENEDEVRVAVAEILHEQAAEPPVCCMRCFDCAIVPILNLFNMYLPPDVLCDKAFKLREEIRELQKEKYEVSTVFVTFETEEGQRAALSALATGKIDFITNNKHHHAPGTLFKDKMLRVEIPPEPSSVRYPDLGAGTLYKLSMRLMNIVITLGIVGVCGYAVQKTRQNLGTSYSGPLVSIFNIIIPLIIKILMRFEPHRSEGSYQASLYLKITFFRWINTAILTKIITPFTSTISPEPTDVLAQINAIMWSELWLVPGLRLLDLFGNLKKHFFAPRARNQDIANLSFQGTFYNMGERYTDLTKIMFTCFFYSALFPATFFFGFAILTIQYYADKYCLLRIWAWSPSIGPELAQFSRRYFFSGALLAYVLASAYAWAQFPYDNLCDPIDSTETEDWSGTYTYVNKTGGLVEVDVNQQTPVVYCSQSWLDYEGFPFPPTPKLQPEGYTWMKGTQEHLTNICGWSSVGALVAFIVIFFGSALTRFALSFFHGVTEPQAQNQHIDFSSNPEIFGYVPQIKKGGFPFPFLACDVDHIDENLIGWTDPSHPYDYHNLIFDVPWEGSTREKYADTATTEPVPVTRPIFSTIKHYPPKWMKDDQASK